MAMALLLGLASLAGGECLVADRAETAPCSLGQRVADPLLATMRGGFRLPNGLDLSLGIDIQTRIDGQLALHTVYASDGGQPAIRVYTGGSHAVPIAPGTQTVAGGPSTAAPDVDIDRSAASAVIVLRSASAAATVTIAGGAPATWQSDAGQTQVPVTPNGPSIMESAGQVSLAVDRAGAVVTLHTPGLEVQQLVGQATGVIVANTASGRVIETVSSINVDLHGLSPALLAGTFLLGRTALSAVIMR